MLTLEGVVMKILLTNEQWLAGIFLSNTYLRTLAHATAALAILGNPLLRARNLESWFAPLTERRRQLPHQPRAQQRQHAIIKELGQAAVGDAAEFLDEPAMKSEIRAEHLGDRERQVTVRHGRKDGQRLPIADIDPVIVRSTGSRRNFHQGVSSQCQRAVDRRHAGGVSRAEGAAGFAPVPLRGVDYS